MARRRFEVRPAPITDADIRGSAYSAAKADFGIDGRVALAAWGPIAAGAAVT
ncbi:hypothetical protein [Nocardia gamkensis]|uniref:hypothetical protein n=1 Tax=Nocardia gamkensis TaxID=352869 RepID=UPI0037CBCD45